MNSTHIYVSLAHVVDFSYLRICVKLKLVCKVLLLKLN
jgi:hypothetical protein